MTIRKRLTLWYAGMLFASVLLIAGLTYHELVVEKQRIQAAPEQDENDEGLDDLLRIILWCGLPAALVGLVGGWWLTRQALAPVTALTQAATRVQEHNLKEQLPRTRSGDELDQLTEVFNAMTTRLGGSFQRIREFTLHASHELKTPLTVMHGELETALREETLSVSQRERLLSQLDEVQRLAKIVDGLTLLTKADAGQVALRLEPVRLDELVHDALADAHLLAQSRAIRVSLCGCEEITIQGDRHRLRQLLLNLTDNAIKYNLPQGTVNLELRCVDASAEFTISNTGAGLPSELQPRVFDRFFRGDESHSHAAEGCGLGLSIVQWIAAAHGGTIQFSSTAKQLTVVTVRLPLARTAVT